MANNNKHFNWMVLTILFIGLTNTAQARNPEGITHIHGLVSPTEGQILLGTHTGAYELNRDGTSNKISTISDDLMTFVPHPSQQDVIYGSGHPVGGGNLGLIRSTDKGRTWSQVSPGINGPVDFHLLTISATDPQRIYGTHKGLQRSTDGGKNWEYTGKVPAKTLSLAASSIDKDRLYAASENGLFVTHDNGKQWLPVLKQQLPSTAVKVTEAGTLYAFVVGKGLMSGDERDLKLTVKNNGFGLRVPMNLALASDNPNTMYAIDQGGSIWTSNDAGTNWGYFINQRELSRTEQQGKTLYQTYCISCHGTEGVGESYSLQSLTDQKFIFAPSLDGSGHAWHHTDENLAETILKGSPRTSKMPAWNKLFSETDVENVIAHMKSLWGKRELDCQGPKHMQCM